MNIIAQFLAKIALTTAKAAAGSASQWLAYQPKEPNELKQLLKK